MRLVYSKAYYIQSNICLKQKQERRLACHSLNWKPHLPWKFSRSVWGSREKKHTELDLRTWTCGFSVVKNLNHYPQSSKAPNILNRKNDYVFTNTLCAKYSLWSKSHKLTKDILRYFTTAIICWLMFPYEYQNLQIKIRYFRKINIKNGT